MARCGRIKSDIGIYHVLLRGMNELFADEKDFDEFKALLQKYTESGNIKIFSYTLLKNRIHIVIETSEDIGKALKPLCTSYARYFNRTYAREGKLFYDRLKSEPINSTAELKAVVAFVNDIGAKEGENYPHCSRTDKTVVCTSDRLTYDERMSTDVTDVFMEDYDCLSSKEIDRYITALCGASPTEFKKLPQNEQQEAIAKLTKKRWISRTKLYTALGIKKPRKKPAETPNIEPKTQTTAKKQELSVWLL